MSPSASPVFTPAQVRDLDRLATEKGGIASFTLMTRAGEAAFVLARARWPDARRWLVVCGAGNNAGDGYVVARLARAAGIAVRVAALGDPARLAGDAATAWSAFVDGASRHDDGDIAAFSTALLRDADLVVDAMLGTGLTRPLAGDYCRAVEAINAADLPVFALDIPTGLDGATGAVAGACIRADVTLTFVGRKQGLYLGQGPDVVGELHFDGLGIPREVVASFSPSMHIVGPADVADVLPPRRPADHKGRFGHVLVVGGNDSMAGAARLAAEAALRSGAGLVSVATRPANAAGITSACPELMCHGVEGGDDLDELLTKATVVAIGPGLGQDDWARRLLARVLDSPLPKVVDADALNLLAKMPARQAHAKRDDWVLTPHPGEAGRMLGVSSADVQADRIGALADLAARYGGTILLKGRCTLIGRHGVTPLVIDRGNPGMATGGTGDVLTGLLAGLIAQTRSTDVRTAGVAAFVHAAAGDTAAGDAPRGLIARDLIGHFRPWLNPGR